jgi:hypothetical protein
MQKVLSSNHHKNVLSEMFKFIDAESLTDVTFVCRGGKNVYAHRKVLAQISPLLRKVISIRPKEERVIVLSNVGFYKNIFALITSTYLFSGCNRRCNVKFSIPHLQG